MTRYAGAVTLRAFVDISDEEVEELLGEDAIEEYHHEEEGKMVAEALVEKIEAMEPEELEEQFNSIEVDSVEKGHTTIFSGGGIGS